MQRPQIYFALMVIAGLVVGLIVARNPAFATGSVSPIMWILFVSLAIDLVMMRLPGNQGVATVPMPWRVTGFIAAVGLYTATSAFTPS